jgi:hypothetical protein
MKIGYARVSTTEQNPALQLAVTGQTTALLTKSLNNYYGKSTQI